MAAVPKTFAELDADPSVRVIVCAGDGEKAFISGADISQFEKLRGTVEAQAEYNKAVEAAYLAPINCSKPVVARIRGICIGGGLGFAAACDMRICFGQHDLPHARRAPGPGLQPERRAALHERARRGEHPDIFVSARKFDAKEAQRMGFVSQVYPVAELEAKVAEYCKMIAENAPLTVAAAKFAVAAGAQGRRRPRHGDRDEDGAGLLRERRPQGRPQGVHGKAHAEFHRQVTWRPA